MKINNKKYFCICTYVEILEILEFLYKFVEKVQKNTNGKIKFIFVYVHVNEFYLIKTEVYLKEKSKIKNSY